MNTRQTTWTTKPTSNFESATEKNIEKLLFAYAQCSCAQERTHAMPIWVNINDISSQSDLSQQDFKATLIVMHIKCSAPQKLHLIST